MKLNAVKGTIQINRDDHGIPHVKADHEADLYFGLGYCHAMDRGMQLLLMRILGYGKACEQLKPTDELLEADLFFRKLNMGANAQSEIDKLTASEQAMSQAYADGINTYFFKKIPWELKLVRYKYQPWTLTDSMMMSRMVSYVTLAQTQTEIERFFILLVQAGASLDMLQELFPGDILRELDMELIKKVKVHETRLPDVVRLGGMLNSTPASNNWVIAGSRTRSGKAIMANDPHLEINRLPAVWYEIVLECKERYIMGASMPGIGGVILGRNNDVSWGVTYTYMDAQDFWIEHCKDGQYLKDGEWHAFTKRKEVIKRKGKDPVEVMFYENEHGVLDGDPEGECYRLSTQWASAFSGGKSASNMLKMLHVTNAAAAMDIVGNIESAWNWVLADTAGNIAYQMSGLLPKRRDGLSGFLPLPGWDSKNDWQGFVAHTDLPRSYNPGTGYFVTANNFLNDHGEAWAINVAMGDYRAGRISQLILEKGNDITPEDCQRWQYDVYSFEAKAFLKTIGPLLPDNEKGSLLKAWDFQYYNDSKAAWLFERILFYLYKIVYGEHGFGLEAFDFLDQETGLFIAFYKNFNDILYREQSVWFKDKTRDEIFRKAIDSAFAEALPVKGIDKKITLKNIFFDGQLPRFFGFDKGPIPLPGSRATINQSQIFKADGRHSSFGPSIRIVADMAKAGLRTNLIGGPSDRRFSKWYASDVENYVNGVFKVLAVKW